MARKGNPISVRLDLNRSSDSSSKKISGIILISFAYATLFYLLKLVSPDYVGIIERIPQFMGGASAIYFIFLSKTCFSKLITLYSFLISSCVLFLEHFILTPDLAMLMIICISCSFIFSYFFIDIENKRAFDLGFIFLFLSRGFIAPEIIEWKIALLTQLLILFGFHYREYQEKKRVVFSLLLLLLPSLYLYYSGVPRDINIVVVLVLAAAGAGGVQFMCLSKTERGQNLALLFYIINNVFLGFILRKEGETFPKITFFFLMTILLLFSFLWLIGKIRSQSISCVLSQCKTMLRGVFLPILFLLNHFFCGDSYHLWITSFVIHILVLLLLKFILKKEDEDPIP